MKIPDDTPVEMSEGAWNLLGDPDALAAGRLPLDPVGIELLRRHRNAAAEGPADRDTQSRFRVPRAGRLDVVVMRTTWWPEPRENSLGFLAPTARFRPSTATGPGPLTLVCLAEEWEALLGERLEDRPWPRDN